ncbi:unnamed protein product [Owenia fusiformis]|uniref:CCHC-type domain-containing protein n=1 Tax=Owenia fusiformis TaxID=6347 RepID=A0A8S4Q4W8_OWEFU|nr:unnamed protein product [Owenia fusiformis]
MVSIDKTVLKAKGELLAIGQLNIQGTLIQISSYTKEALTPPERVSIHGIPLHISNSEVEGWIAEMVNITSPVQYAMKGTDKMKINTGNRFCYGHVKDDVILPRYNRLPLNNPFDNEAIIEYEVTVYINSQPINCARCLELNHMSRECPSKKPQCRKCGQIGHIARLCTQQEQDDDDDIAEPKQPDDDQSHDGEAGTKSEEVASEKSEEEEEEDQPETIPEKIYPLFDKNVKDAKSRNMNSDKVKKAKAKPELTNTKTPLKTAKDLNKKRPPHFTPPSVEKSGKQGKVS